MIIDAATAAAMVKIIDPARDPYSVIESVSLGVMGASERELHLALLESIRPTTLEVLTGEVYP